MARLLFYLFPLVLTLLIFTGCANNKDSPSLPAVTPVDGTGNSMPVCNAPGSHGLWGYWDIIISPDDLNVEIIPDRNALYHYNMTNSLQPPDCSDCIKITAESWDPVGKIIEVNVTLKNPTIHDGKDIRGIFFTDILERTVVNADGWTPLFDIPGGDDINPFIAFTKSDPTRVFMHGASHTENYKIHMTHWGPIHFAIEASWPENCEEPYEIGDFNQEPITEDAGWSGTVSVVVNDWQHNTDEVTLYATEISGTEFIPMESSEGITWHCILANNMAVPAGTYEALIKAGSENDGDLSMYNRVSIDIHVTHPPLNPSVVTPPWLNPAPLAQCVDGDYLYTAGKASGVHVWDISSPENPLWVNRCITGVDVTGVFDIKVEDGIAYTLRGTSSGSTQMFDVDPPEDINLIATINPSNYYHDVENGYLYNMPDFHTLEISKIEPDGSLIPTSSLDTNSGSSIIRDVKAFDGYFYIKYDSYDSLIDWITIVDVDPPESPEIVNQLYYEQIWSFCASGNLLCVKHSDTLDLVSVPSGDILNTLPAGQFNYNPKIIDGYLYIVATSLGSAPTAMVFDIHDPENAYLVDSIWASNTPQLERKNNILYAVDRYVGIRIFDFTPGSDSTFLKTIPSPSQSAGKIYYQIAVGPSAVAATNGGIDVLGDITPPETASLISAPIDDLWCRMNKFLIDGNFLYGGNAWPDLYITDITDPDLPVIVKKVHRPNGYAPISCIAYDKGTLYIAASGELEIYDVDPPESTVLLDSVNLELSYSNLDASNGYLYLLASGASGNDFLHIVDISDPMNPEFVKTLENPDGSPDYNPYCVKVYGNYVYVGLGNSYGGELRIIDISSPPNAFYVKSVFLPRKVYDMGIVSDYVLIPGFVVMDGFYVVDILWPEHAFLSGSFDTGFRSQFLDVNDTLACMTSPSGLEIVNLW